MGEMVFLKKGIMSESIGKFSNFLSPADELQIMCNVYRNSHCVIATLEFNSPGRVGCTE